MKNVLFVIRTPLQLFNAVEAVERFHRSDNCLLLVYYKRQVDLDLMRSQYGSLWVEVIEFEFRGFSQIFYPFLLARKKILKIGFDIIYIGLISNVPLHLANCNKSSQIRLLDDGNEIIKISRTIESKTVRESTYICIRNYILGRRLTLHRLKGAIYFSRYRLSHVPQDRTILNDYREFKRKVREIPRKNIEIFIGSNLSPQYLSEADYIFFLKSVRNENSSELLYCPHRYESDELIKKIQAIGFGLIRFDSILECAFIKQMWAPIKVSTVRSTAVDTLNDLYEVDKTLYRVPRAMLKNDEVRKEFDAIYSDHARNNTLVVAPLGK